MKALQGSAASEGLEYPDPVNHEPIDIVATRGAGTDGSVQRLGVVEFDFELEEVSYVVGTPENVSPPVGPAVASVGIRKSR